jgi:hypothetical protein
MEINDEIFYLDHNTGQLRVGMINLPGQVLFRVNFPDGTPGYLPGHRSSTIKVLDVYSGRAATTAVTANTSHG